MPDPHNWLTLDDDDAMTEQQAKEDAADEQRVDAERSKSRDAGSAWLKRQGKPMSVAELVKSWEKK